MSTSIDQKAYLQKYLGGPSKDKKKKKKKAIKGKGFKIIDDDIDLSKLRPLDGDELDILDQGEDAPQIAGIVDERPEELRKLEQFKTSSKWRVINQDDGFNSSLQIEEIQKDIKETEKENEVIFGKMYSDSEDDNEKNKNGSDLSPPRKKASKKHDNDSDFSPPRKRESPKRKHTETDPSPPRKRDLSPKRKETKYDADTSPPRKQTHKERVRKKPSRWGDAEPENSTTTSPKRNARSQDSDLSPPRYQKKSDSDESPPRKRKTSPHNKNYRNNKTFSPSAELSRRNDRQKSPSTRKSKRSPESSSKHFDKETSRRDKDWKDTRNRKRHNSDSDLSPPRRNKDANAPERNRNMSDRDRISKDKRRRSPSLKHRNRKQESDSDLSPPRKGNVRNMTKDKTLRRSISPQNIRNHDSDSDLSPPRRGKDRNSDKSRNMSDKNKNRRGSDSPPPSNKKMAKTLEGKVAGLQDARHLREENEEFRRKEDEVFKKLSDDVSGRNAQAVSRKGKRDTSEERQKQRDKASKQKELDAKYKLWNRGLKQIEAEEAQVQDYMHEASKPLARHKDDKDLEKNLKQIERAGDPMLNYIRDRKRERGELAPEKPSYKGQFPPNRFNIRPGYRWDGLDRSNGYEKKYFDQMSKRKAQEEEAYKWSTEDL